MSRVDRQGYERINRNTPVHKLVAEKVLGRAIPNGACVHHVNGDRADNRTGNLVICPSASYHMLIHQRSRAFDACGNANWRLCNYCFKYDAPENLYIRGRHSRHRECFNRAWLKRHYEKRDESCLP